MPEFIYEPVFQYGEDDTQYRLLTRQYVSEVEVGGRKLLKVEPEALRAIARHAFADVSFYLRPKHLQQLADELKDPEASDNDKFVVYTHWGYVARADVKAKEAT